MQIHPVEHVRDQLLQEQAGRNPDLAAKPAGSLGELNIVVPQTYLDKAPTVDKGLF